MSHADLALTVKRHSDELDATVWDALCMDNPFMQHRWLRLLEAVVTDWVPYYLLLHEGSRLVAGAVCFRQRRFHVSAYLEPGLYQHLLRLGLRLSSPMTCGLPVFGGHSALLLAEPPAPSLDRVLWVVERFAWQQGAPFLGVDSLDEARAARLRHRYLLQPLPTEAVLALGHVESYDEYEQALPKKKRSEVRRLRNRAREAGVTITVGPLEGRYGDDVARLIAQTASRHHNPFLYRPGFLASASALLPQNAARLLLAWHEGDIIGTVCVFREGSNGLLKWIGLDYARTEENYAYHFMMTESVRAALELGVEQFTLGGRSWPLKKHMGAEPAPRFAAARLRWRPVHAAARWVLARGRGVA